MREIEYRGKVIDELNEWVYGYLADENTIFQKEAHQNSKSCGTGYFIVDPETVGQYTRLKDKNGTKIFEKDIVLYEDWEMAYEGGGNDSFINKGIIEYVPENACFNVTEKQTIELADVLYEGNETLEVIRKHSR